MPSLQLATAKSLAFGVIAVVWLAVLAANQVLVLLHHDPFFCPRQVTV